VLIEIVEAGILKLSKLPKGDWWTPRDGMDKVDERGRIGLSELDSCIRKLWYQWHEQPKTNAPDIAMHPVWWAGHFYENMIIRALEADGLPILGRQETLKWGDLEGHTDGKFETSAHPVTQEALGEDKLFLLELKSAKPQRIKDLKRKGAREVTPGYFVQAQTYMEAHYRTFGKKLDGAVILFANKAPDFKFGTTDLMWYEEVITPSPVTAELKFEYVTETVEKPTIPARPYEKPTGLCPHCPFMDECWRGWTG
jgi:hypothetical protein